jgi:uncharacterized protein YbaA (DUF1428 family)
MPYVDGYVIPVPKKHLKAYEKMAKAGARVWMDHGALSYNESVGEDLNVKFGMPFPKAIKTKAGETIVFSWIVYKSRAHRDAVNAKCMKDPRLANLCDPKKMPFDPKRMCVGGFKVFVSG